MGDLTRDTHFRMKPREGGSVLRKRLWKKLDGYHLAERQILGAVDFAHAATPGKRDDAVAAGEDLSGNESAAADEVGTGQEIQGAAARRSW